MAMSNKTLRPRASGFNPKSIAGLYAWYDAADASTITQATGVSAWADKSGNGRTCSQATGGSQPAYVLAGQNGKNVIDYGTNASNALVQTLASAFTLSQPVTFFCAYKTPLSSTYTAFDVTNATFDGTGRLLCYGNTGSEFRLNAGSDVLVSTTADAWLIRLVLGANFGFVGSLRSYMGECGMYLGTLTDSQHTSILKYLAKKWAVTLV